jgi:hypothetical protein
VGLIVVLKVGQIIRKRLVKRVSMLDGVDNGL